MIKIFSKSLFKISNKKTSRLVSGFTLMEILITMAIFSLIMGAISVFARNVYYYNNIFSGGLVSYDQAKKILQPIASEIRGASSSSLGAYPLETTGDTSFVFFTDTNNDGIKERIRYFVSGVNLMRGVIVPSGNPIQYVSANETISTVVEGIRNGATPVFTYYDTNYTGSSAALTQPVSVLNVRLVKITLIIDNDPNRPPLPITVTTEVSVRNLKDNL